MKRVILTAVTISMVGAQLTYSQMSYAQTVPTSSLAEKAQEIQNEALKKQFEKSIADADAKAQANKAAHMTRLLEQRKKFVHKYLMEKHGPAAEEYVKTIIELSRRAELGTVEIKTIQEQMAEADAQKNGKIIPLSNRDTHDYEQRKQINADIMNKIKAHYNSLSNEEKYVFKQTLLNQHNVFYANGGLNYLGSGVGILMVFAAAGIISDGLTGPSKIAAGTTLALVAAALGTIIKFGIYDTYQYDKYSDGLNQVIKMIQEQQSVELDLLAKESFAKPLN